MLSQEHLVEQTLRELESPEALEAFRANCYWPKWDGPWWKMRLIFELGHASRIPKPALEGLVASLEAMPFHISPLTPDELAQVKNPWLDTGCHCQVGTMFTVLAAAGVDVPSRVPWLRRWLSE